MSAHVECDECGATALDRPAGTQCRRSQCPGTMRARVVLAGDPFGILTAPEGSGRTAERNADEAFALAMVPVGKDIADYVAGKLPEGVEYSVFLKIPSADRVVVVSSDRSRMVRAVAHWVMDTLEAMGGDTKHYRRTLMVDDKMIETRTVPWKKAVDSSHH
jgi:hypothetical protein